MAGSSVRKQQSMNMFYLTLVLFPLVSIIATGGILAKALNVAIPLNTIIYAFVSVVFIAIGILMPKVKANNQVGIRMPWIMYDEALWNKTHRFAGPLWIVCGSIGLIGSFTVVKSVIFLAVLTVAVLVPVGYSAAIYFKYKK